MSTKKYLKKKIVFFFISMIFISISTVVTFCFMNKNMNDLVYEENNLKVIYQNGKEGIKVSNIPLSYEDGIDFSPSNLIKIINKETFDTDYIIKVTTSNNIDDLTTDKLYVSVNNENGKLLSSIKDGIILKRRIHSNEEDIVNIKFWVANEYIENDDYHKTLKINIEVKEK